MFGHILLPAHQGIPEAQGGIGGAHFRPADFSRYAAPPDGAARALAGAPQANMAMPMVDDVRAIPLTGGGAPPALVARLTPNAHSHANFHVEN